MNLYLEKASALAPELIRTTVMPFEKEENRRSLKKGDKVVFDFGDHQVGYVTLKLKSVGSPQDAPAFIRLKFAEIEKELHENADDYDGWISRGWIQEECIHIDVLPAVLELQRRYAFRYLEVSVIDTSQKFQLVIEDVSLSAVSSADQASVDPLGLQDEKLKKLDKVSIRTLQNCMQDVFEDGPKRDRRLWIGDLRLQAKVNYVLFRNYDLVKRCLYLFAGLTREDGKVSACLFTEPEYIGDDTYIFDYSLFFIDILKDYYQETNDIAFVEELWDCAYRQIELSRLEFDDTNLYANEETMSCFVDWKEGLDRQASAQAIYIQCLKNAVGLADVLGKTTIAQELQDEIQNKTEAALRYLWDDRQKFFVSGKDRQVSYASQVWMVLAGVVNKEEGALLLHRIAELNPEMGMVTPYANSHYVEALLMCGEKQQALDYLNYYWGGMLVQGADTFWEMYNPENPDESPYGSSIVNSYCHAWSCMPSFFIRKYFL